MRILFFFRSFTELFFKDRKNLVYSVTTPFSLIHKCPKTKKWQTFNLFRTNNRKVSAKKNRWEGEVVDVVSECSYVVTMSDRRVVSYCYGNQFVDAFNEINL